MWTVQWREDGTLQTREGFEELSHAKAFIGRHLSPQQAHVAVIFLEADVPGPWDLGGEKQP